MRSSRKTTSLVIRHALCVTLWLFLGVSGAWAATALTTTDPDVNDDGIVDLLDLSFLGSCFGREAPNAPENSPCCKADTNGDDQVDLTDYLFVVSGFGQQGFPLEPGLNCPPVADAGESFPGTLHQPLQLDGRDSWDPDGDPLTYRWSVVSSPQGSHPELADPTAEAPTVQCDRCGSYVMELVVNDGWYDSAPDRVVVEIEEPVPPDIDAPHNVDFGCVEAGDWVELDLTVRNVGGSPLTVTGASTDNPVFTVSPVPGEAFPLVLAPGASSNLRVGFHPPADAGDATFSGTLTIFSDDPDEAEFLVRLVGRSVLVKDEENNSVTGARVVYDPAGPLYDLIDAATCEAVGWAVWFGAASSPADSFQVVLTDGGGQTAFSGAHAAPEGVGEVAVADIAACDLADGIVEVSVVLSRNGQELTPYVGTPAVKNTSTLGPPILDPLDPVTVFSAIEVCGTSREDTTVSIQGGAQTVSVALGPEETRFCVEVPLRKNAQNTLTACAVDARAAAPRPVACALPVGVFQVDPSEIVIAEAYSRPLTTEEIEELVAAGVIDLDDPANYNVSMFTVVLSIRGHRKTITYPVARPRTGGGGGRIVIPAPGWSGGGGGGGLPDIRRPCTVGCYQPIVIPPPEGHEEEDPIPGVIIIDGRIKTLKEFFQVTLVVWNTSPVFTLSGLGASIDLPGGLTPLAAGPGSDVSEVNRAGTADRVEVGDVGPGETGQAQFIVRGDAIGTHRVDVNYYGFLTGGGLPVPWPVAGSAATTVDVLGPPELGVVVRHPSDPDGDDVVAGEVYDLLVDITNLSNRPALYASLELFVGGAARLVDENGDPLPDSNRILSLGHIQPGQTVQAAFRVEALADGEIIACQAIAGENITLTVDTGGAGGECLINNMYPAHFEPLPEDMPPTLIGINPLNGQRNVPDTASVVAVFTPPSACLYADSWAEVVTTPLDPEDPTQGDEVVSGRLVDRGTFYLEELDPFGISVQNIPADLSLFDPPAGGTTIGVLRPGQGLFAKYYLRSNTTYRATLVGEDLGDAAAGEAICNQTGTAFLETSYRWTFSTAQPCQDVTAPTVMLVQPEDGSSDRPVTQPVVLRFPNRMSAGSFRFDPHALDASTFGVYQNAAETGGDLSGGDPVPGSGRFNALLNTLTYTPSMPLAQDATVHVRVTDGVRDVCGNALQVPAGGVQLFRFQTEPPDTTPPETPEVNPVPALTNLLAIQVSGIAEPGSTVTVEGGAAARTAVASDDGLFSAVVPLARDALNSLEVYATDGSGNASAPASFDIAGDPLGVVNDVTPPQVVSWSPGVNQTGVPRDAQVRVAFDEPILAASITPENFVLEGSEVPGALSLEGDRTLVFTPDDPLAYNHPYTVRLRAGGIKDPAGNGLAEENAAGFLTVPHPAPVLTGLDPDSGVQGTEVEVTLTGSNLETAYEAFSDNPEVSAVLQFPTDPDEARVVVTVGGLAATGATTLGIRTEGGEATLPFSVLHKAPTVENVIPPSGEQGTTVDVEVHGNGLSDLQSIDACPGVVATDLGTGDDSRLNLRFAIDDSATPGPCPITITTPGGSSEAPFTVTATQLASLEVIPESTTIQVGAVQPFTATGTYSNGSTRNLTEAVSWTSSDTAVATVNDAAGSRGQATGQAAGSCQIWATDTETGITASAAVTVKAVVANRDPVITSQPVTLARVNSPYAYDVAAEDPDGDDLNYRLEEAPAGMSIDPVTGLIEWTPTSIQTVPVVVVVDDSRGGSGSQSYTLSVEEEVLTVFSCGFETDACGFAPDGAVWEIGETASGPGSCYSGSACAATRLAGDYPAYDDDRLVSGELQLPVLASGEEVHLRFWQWFSYSSYDSGQVYVAVIDEVSGTQGAWEAVGGSIVQTSGVWSLMAVDLTAYAGQRVRLGFQHSAQRSPNSSYVSESTGWYIDDIQVVVKVPEFTGDFEAGWGDWSATRGIWQVGTPTAGPGGCYSGTQCAGTVLNGNYAALTDSLLLSPTFELPAAAGAEEVQLRFWQWFSYSSYDSGQVYVAVIDEVSGTQGAWEAVGGSIVQTSGVWSLMAVDLTAYAGQRVRLGFQHSAQRSPNSSYVSESTGWYIDDIQVVSNLPAIAGEP